MVHWIYMMAQLCYSVIAFGLKQFHTATSRGYWHCRSWQFHNNDWSSKIELIRIVSDLGFG